MTPESRPDPRQGHYFLLGAENASTYQALWGCPRRGAIFHSIGRSPSTLQDALSMGRESCSCLSLCGWMVHSPPESSKSHPPLHPGPGVQNRHKSTVHSSVTMQMPTCFIFFLISVVTSINLFSSSHMYNIQI